MIVIGLTGSIGMGKSTTAKLLRGFGFPVYSADEAVHDALEKGGGAYEKVAKAFPEAVKKGRIDRKALGKAVFGDAAKLRKLEGVVHPVIHRVEREIVRQAHKDKMRAVVLDIPLLFEIKANRRCDIVLCVHAPRHVQKARVMKRRGMTEEKFRAIVRRQMADTEKCRRADYVVPTGTSVAVTKAYLERLLKKLGLIEKVNFRGHSKH